MRIVLQIRRTPGYYLRNEYNLTYIVQSDNELSYVVECIKIWNFCFKMQWMDFRKRLREIAFKTFSRNDFNDIIMYYDRERFSSLPKGTLVIPIDEDDWLSPNLVRELRNVEDPFETIRWDNDKKYSRYEPDNYPEFIRKHASSCNYGVKIPCDYNIIRWHSLFKKKEAFYLPKKLSYKHSNISSLSVYYELMSRGFTFKKLMNDVIDEIGKYEYPEEYKKEGYLYEELLKELLDSRKKKR